MEENNHLIKDKIIEIDYTITYQDDLDSWETNSEYSFNRPWVKWLIIRGVTASSLISGLLLIVEGISESDDPNAVWLICLGILCLVIGCILPFIFNPKLAQSGLNRRQMQKNWSKKSTQAGTRNFTLTKTELIFKTAYSQLTWKQAAFKKYFVGEKGFLLWFYTGDLVYIPKRIFKDREEVNNLAEILKKYVSSSKL